MYVLLVSSCFLILLRFAVLTQGMLEGGNIGEMMNSEVGNYTYPGGHWKAVILYEFIVWALLSIILLNLVLGIIVDVSHPVVNLLYWRKYWFCKHEFYLLFNPLL